MRTPDGLRRLADAARNKDHGVARLARKRIDAIAAIARVSAADADAILEQLEALATRPGPILTAVIELNRRWQALDIGEDAARVARCDAARQALQARFDREHEEQRTRARFERRLDERTATRNRPDRRTRSRVCRAELAALRDEARRSRGRRDALAAGRGRAAHRAVDAGAAGAGRRRSARRRSRTARRGDIDRRREAAGAVAGAGARAFAHPR